jgi:hypothetical protein
MDRFVQERLVSWLHRRGGQRLTQRVLWTAEQSVLTARYRAIPGPSRISQNLPMVIEFKKPEGNATVSESVTPMRDGNQIVALLGPDLQAGMGGLGTPRLKHYGTWRPR